MAAARLIDLEAGCTDSEDDMLSASDVDEGGNLIGFLAEEGSPEVFGTESYDSGSIARVDASSSLDDVARLGSDFSDSENSLAGGLGLSLSDDDGNSSEESEPPQRLKKAKKRVSQKSGSKRSKKIAGFSPVRSKKKILTKAKKIGGRRRKQSRGGAQRKPKGKGKNRAERGWVVTMWGPWGMHPSTFDSVTKSGVRKFTSAGFAQEGPPHDDAESSHWQGYFYAANVMTMSAVQKMLKKSCKQTFDEQTVEERVAAINEWTHKQRAGEDGAVVQRFSSTKFIWIHAHTKPMQGTKAQAIGYSGGQPVPYTTMDGRVKQPSAVYVGWGEQPALGQGAGFRTDLMQIEKKIRAGMSVEKVVEEAGLQIYHSWGRAMEKLQQWTMARARRGPGARCRLIWIYGLTGCGKSHIAFGGPAEITYNHPIKKGNQWFCNYRPFDDKIVVFNEMRKGQVPFGFLLGCADKWPMRVNSKGEAAKPMLAETIIVTSPFGPEQMYEGSLEEGDNVDQLWRRLGTKCCANADLCECLAPVYGKDCYELKTVNGIDNRYEVFFQVWGHWEDISGAAPKFQRAQALARADYDRRNPIAAMGQPALTRCETYVTPNAGRLSVRPPPVRRMATVQSSASVAIAAERARVGACGDLWRTKTGEPEVVTRTGRERQ